MRTLLRVGLYSCLAGACFGWGYFVHRNQVFPHSLLKRLGVIAGVVRQPQVHPDPPPGGMLEALPYVDGTFDGDADLAGVVMNDRSRSCPGVNFYASGSAAYLVDSEGGELHRWTYPSKTWEHAELLPDGRVLAVVKEERLLCLDAESNLEWEHRGRFHHDTSVSVNGEVYALSRRARVVEGFHATAPVLDDLVLRYSPDGTLLDEISMTDVFMESGYGWLLPAVQDRSFEVPGVEIDVLHTNHVEVFDGKLAQMSPLYAEGNLLLSFKHVHSIAIMDGRSKKLVWLWGPTNLVLQHHPTLTSSGTLTVFNNGTKRSSVLEVDPRTGAVVWRYAPGRGLFSASRGSAQRLPNGNTLITESDTGYVIEVTPEGETVWRFANPDVTTGQMRRFIWRMTRYAPESLSFLLPAGGG